MTTPTAPVSALTHAASKVFDVHQTCYRLYRELKEFRLRDAASNALDAVNLLVEQGAVSPIDSAAPVADLTGLAQMDTSEARELLAALVHAQALAEVVDAQRNNVLPERIPIGLMESRGTDIADSISHIRIRLHMELHPPTGRGE